MTIISFRVAAAAVAALCFASGAAHAQSLNTSADGHYGAVQLRSGFTPDPHNVEVRAGGDYDASGLGSSCRGMIAVRPDYTVRYTTGDWPLRFYATSESDTTLVVRLPDGSYLCDDDGGESLNPLVHLRSPRSGRYQIWVGTFSGGADNPAATLHVSELEQSAQAGGLNWGEEPNYGATTLNAGFTPDPHVVQMQAGGSVDASQSAAQCSGWATTAPDFNLTYNPGSFALTISAQSSSDTTLIINGPNGEWYCNDDTNGLNPEVRFDTPQSGLYNIWVGTYADGATQSAQLRISEVARPRGK